nr:uncharacterized protein LOC111510917 [Leptinotarsa decemlineata]
MAPRIWARSKDGSILYMSLTTEYIEGAIKVLEKGFYPRESICRAINLASDKKAVAELNKLCLCVAEDGVSVIAVEKNTNTVCAVAINKLQVPGNPEDDSFFAEFSKSCESPLSRRLIQFMYEADASCDLFEHCKVDCLLELMFLATLPEFGRRGIGFTICEVTTEVARRLYLGENVKESLDGTELKLEPVPKLVAALFTAPQSQAIGRSARWELAATVFFKDLFFDGKSFASVLEETNRTSEVRFKRLR